jgi:hypothetical protein
MANKAQIKAQMKSAPSPKKTAAPVLKITLGKNGPSIASTNKENAIPATQVANNIRPPSAQTKELDSKTVSQPVKTEK